MSSFNDVVGVWSERLENVRNLVRQQVIHQQLMTHTRSAALAYRPGLRRQWQLALATFDATTYVSELCDELHATLDQFRLIVRRIRRALYPLSVCRPVDRDN